MIHPSSSRERWQTLDLMAQLANIGSEVSRTLRAHERGDSTRFDPALDRMLELFELTLADPRWKGRRKEICRAREVVLDYLLDGNQFHSTAEWLDAYFMHFAMAARRTLGTREGQKSTATPANSSGTRPTSADSALMSPNSDGPRRTTTDDLPSRC